LPSHSREVPERSRTFLPKTKVMNNWKEARGRGLKGGGEGLEVNKLVCWKRKEKKIS